MESTRIGAQPECGCLLVLSGPLRRDGKHDRCCAIYHRPVRDLFLRPTERLRRLTAAGKWRNSNRRHFGEGSEIIRSNWLIWCHHQPQMKRLCLWDVVSTLHTSVCLMMMRTASVLQFPFRCNCILFAALFATRFSCYGGTRIIPIMDLGFTEQTEGVHSRTRDCSRVNVRTEKRLKV